MDMLSTMKAYVSAAFISQAQRFALAAPKPRSKGIPTIHAGRSSSVRKFIRAERIKAGLRPDSYELPTRRERTIAEKASRRQLAS